MPLGNQLEDELLLADIDGVAGVVAALVARDDVEPVREQVDDLALAFVAPLRAQHDHITHSPPPALAHTSAKTAKDSIA